MQILEKREVFDYTAKKYQSAHYKIDLYQVFIENSLLLLKKDGFLSYITPNTYLKNIHSEPLRRFILENTSIIELLMFYYQVFNQASVDVCICLIKKTISDEKHTITIKEAREKLLFKAIHKRQIEQNSFYLNERLAFTVSIDETAKKVVDKIRLNSSFLGNFCGAYFGIQTWNRKLYVSKKQNKNYKPVIDGGNIHRYYLLSPNEYVLFEPNAIKSGGNEKIYLQDRICTRQIGLFPVFSLVKSGIFALNTVYNIYKKDENMDLKFILGILNSKVVQFYWKKLNYDEKRTFPKIKKEALLTIPIPNLNLNDKIQGKQHEQLIKLVEAMLELNKRLLEKNSQTQHDQIKRRIQHLDQEIDNLVYQLYDLNETEIALIEGENV